MKSESQLMSELSHRTNYLRELSEEEAKGLKKAILDVYLDIAALCEKNSLTYMLAGGSCLGAIRHQGFIPWDDDLDLMMPREDYDKLINLLKMGALGPKYEFTYPQKGKDANNVFLKIFRKGTLNIELANKYTPFPKGIFLDIFPIEAVPQSKTVQRIKGFIANVIHYISISRLYTQYPSKELKEYMEYDVILKKRYRNRILLGRIMGFASHAKWIYWFDRFVASTKPNKPWGIPSGKKYYNGEIFERSVFVPVKKAKFEGLDVNVPNDTHRYLTNLYNNYMEIPPVEKRERHFVCELKLPE